jgi:hypothetical protein
VFNQLKIFIGSTSRRRNTRKRGGTAGRRVSSGRKPVGRGLAAKKRRDKSSSSSGSSSRNSSDLSSSSSSDSSDSSDSE